MKVALTSAIIILYARVTDPLSSFQPSLFGYFRLSFVPLTPGASCSDPHVRRLYGWWRRWDKENSTSLRAFSFPPRCWRCQFCGRRQTEMAWWRPNIDEHVTTVMKKLNPSSPAEESIARPAWCNNHYSLPQKRKRPAITILIVCWPSPVPSVHHQGMRVRSPAPDKCQKIILSRIILFPLFDLTEKAVFLAGISTHERRINRPWAGFSKISHPFSSSFNLFCWVPWA